MKTLRNLSFTLLLCLLLPSCGNTFSFSPGTVISVENKEQEAVAEWFAWLFASPGGFVPKVDTGHFGADVVLREDSSLDEAAYRIKVTSRKTYIEASSPTGFFYALQFIRQQLPPDISSTRHADYVEWNIPVMSRYDAPATRCGGLVLDMCCRYLPKENVLHLIESMPEMGLRDLYLVNDTCFTHEDIEEMFSCADSHDIVIVSEYMMNSAGLEEQDYELVWKDDFSGIDERYWSRISRGEPDWRNYMSSHDSLYNVKGGCLILKALENVGLDQADTASFLTGGIYTKDKFTIGHGKIEVRAKLPMAKSVWPAIWMMPQEGNWPDAGEIDVMEHFGSNDFVYQTIHSGYASTLGIKEPKPSAKVKVNPEKFNIYGVEILPDSLVFSVNGKPTLTYPRLVSGEYAGQVQYPFGRPYYILIDMQIGGTWVGPATGEDLPAEMKVDWIKVYRPKHE